MAKQDVLAETTEKVTTYVNEQIALAEKCWALYQAQVEKASKLWTDTATKVVTEAQGDAKAWMALATQVAADTRKAFEANWKETTKAMTPAA